MGREVKNYEPIEVGQLPPGVMGVPIRGKTRTAWPQLMRKIAAKPMVWFRCPQEVINVAVAKASAQRATAKLYGDGAAVLLEFASEESPFSSEKNRLYIRFISDPVRVRQPEPEQPIHQNPSMAELESFFAEADPADVENYIDYAMAEETE